MVTAVDQVLLALRVAWLCHSDAVWAEQAAEARSFGFDESDLRRVAEGPATGWGNWDAVALRAADELSRDSFLSDDTWNALAGQYNARQMLDVLFRGCRVHHAVDDGQQFRDRLPTDVARHSESAGATPVRLDDPRLSPVLWDAWTDEQRELLDADGTGQSVLNLYMTLVRSPALYRPRAAQSAHIRTGSTLSGRVREILILRIGWLCGAEHEWA